ncbi:SIMPL domain-containing protein [Mariniphaga sediminis]|uniref:SIMPL domain-containing protein n=1 Tax=Mariniphaga sediminis TaxID=1628158 RepID=UPI003565DD4C
MKYLLLLVISVFTLSLHAQDKEGIRYIELKGNAEMEVEPDEMVLHIGIEEYWEEEFEKKKEPEDYKTKVPLASIEDSLIKSLREAGIKKENVKVRGMGNYWRQRGKEFLFSKQFEVKIADFPKVNKLSGLLDSRGIKYMNVGQMSHSDIETFKTQVRANALKDAREKASLMVESLGEELGEVLSISEINDGYIQPYMAKGRMMAMEASTESINQVQDITVSYQVMVKFRIK